MPLYEYQCKKCKHRFEKIHQSYSDPRVKKCPECGGPVEQLLSAPAVQFKGSGWYVTDYARKSEGGSSKSSGDSGPGSSSDSGGDDSSAAKAVEKSASDDKGEHKEKKGKAKKKH